jgi:hypothetical protein
MVGQDSAVTMVADAIDSWLLYQQDNHHHHNNHKSDTTTNHRRQPPLLLFFSGIMGVGKLELAKQVARHVLSTPPCHGDMQQKERILVLSGHDYKQQQQQQQQQSNHPTTRTAGATALLSSAVATSPRQRLGLQIAEHASSRWKNTGAVIIITHVEDMAEGLFAELCWELHQRRQPLSQQNSKPSTAESPVADDALSPFSVLRQVDLSNTIFIFTSNVGTKSMAKSIKAHYSHHDNNTTTTTSIHLSNLSPLELQLNMAHEIDLQLGEGRQTSNHHQRIELGAVRSIQSQHLCSGFERTHF